MSFLIGLVAAIVSMLCWGSYFVPMKKIKRYDPFYFQLLMGITIFISSLIISLLYNSFIFSYLGILSGILWSFGNFLSILAVKSSGLSKSTPVWMTTGIFVSFLWGVLFFKENVSITLGIIGIIFLILGIILISPILTGENKKSNLKSIISAIIAGIIFGSYLVPFKLTNLQPIPFLFPMSLGIFIGCFLIYLIKRSEIDKKIIIQGISSGLIWNIANFASFFAVLNLGISIGFPLTQMALFISVLWGLFYFHEVKDRYKII